MKRKFFEATKQGIEELEKYYPGCENVLTFLRDGKMYITSGDNITEEEKKEYNLL